MFEDIDDLCFLNEIVVFLLLYVFEIIYIVVNREISLDINEICRFSLKEDFFRDLEQNVNKDMIFVMDISYEKVEQIKLSILFQLCLDKMDW